VGPAVRRYFDRGVGRNLAGKACDFKAHNLYAGGGYEALSGDDPSTVDRIEGWNPLFARFVKPSELYVYSGMYENGLAYWSNLRGVTAETGLDLSRSIRLKGTWSRFAAPQCFRGNADIFTGRGHVRGHDVQMRADFRLRESWKAHILVERMLPGDFYTHGSPGYFLRFETSFQIRTTLLPKEFFRRSS
jgi:hypothetical protein